jgi:hypothetical protein
LQHSTLRQAGTPADPTPLALLVLLLLQTQVALFLLLMVGAMFMRQWNVSGVRAAAYTFAPVSQSEGSRHTQTIGSLSSV